MGNLAFNNEFPLEIKFYNIRVAGSCLLPFMVTRKE